MNRMDNDSVLGATSTRSTAHRLNRQLVIQAMIGAGRATRKNFIHASRYASLLSMR